MPHVEPLLLRVREILFREWDPIGVNGNPKCQNEYDSYAPGICRLLLNDADESRLAQHLSRLQRESMGMSVIDEERHHRVARRLLGLMAPK
jgi:hypothetical protein